MDKFKTIQYEGDNTTFVWKHPLENFDAGTQLVVYESQEAIFFSNGQALDSFGPGRHTLVTENLPLVKNHFRLTGTFEKGFQSSVYFVNLVEQMAVKWGTDSRVQFLEPTYQFPLSIGASGDMSIRVNNARLLLLKLVGTETLLTQAKLVAFLRSILLTKVKSYIAQALKTKTISIFEIDQHLEQFSADLLSLLKQDFNDYGLSLERFYVTSVAKPDGEREYERFKELHFRQYADVAEANLDQKVKVIRQQTQAQQMVIESQAIATKRAQEGYSYQDERGFDVAEKVAQNDAVAPMTNLGVGLGTMAGVGVALGSKLGQAVGQAVQSTPTSAGFCANCGKPVQQSDQFCGECGTPVQNGLGSCVKCSHVFTAPGKFCPKCGTPRG